MLADVLVSTSWRSGSASSARSARTRGGTASADDVVPAEYEWRQGRFCVTLSRDQETGTGPWMVRVTSTGRLSGPIQTLYEERHAEERHACWDVMARVIRASRDEDEGLRAGRAAAAWVAATRERTARADA